MVTPDAKRKAVAHACAVHGVSQRPSGVPGSEDRPFDDALHQHPSGRRSVA